MTDCAAPHAGIELDVLDLSKKGKLSSFPEPAKPNSGKIDYKTFAKSLLKTILDNDCLLSFSVQIQDVNKILNLKYSSASDIADVILKDVALTTKLLKLVNSSFYGQFSNKGIATISEAMIILGTEKIKLAATSLKIYEFMQEIANITILKDKALKAIQRSVIARQIAIDEGIKEAEAIQISAMLYDFGEYLVALFSPEVFVNIEIIAEEKQWSREQASKSIIGISYSALGRFVLSRWHLPDTIIYAMKPVTEFNVAKNGLTSEDLQRHICAFSNELCNIEFSMEGHTIDKKIMATSNKYKQSLEISYSKSIELLKTSWDKITKHASILKMPSKKG